MADDVISQAAQAHLPTMRVFVNQLPEETLREIIADWELFEERGSIGECVLRKTARAYMVARHIPVSTGITLIMRDIAFETFRLFVMRYVWRTT